MNEQPTRRQIAQNYDLWGQYVDPQGLDSRERFEAMSLAEKMAFQERCFGPERPNRRKAGRTTMTTTKTTHTPGPWTTGDAEWRTIVGPQTRFYTLDGERRLSCVAVIERSDDEPEDLANARLIAAAPALLAACKRALAWYDREDGEDSIPPGLWMEQLRAAVRLAEGGAHGS